MKPAPIRLSSHLALRVELKTATRLTGVGKAALHHELQTDMYHV